LYGKPDKHLTMIRFVLVCLVVSLSTPAAVLSDDAVQFSAEILPILSDRCFLCHGPDEATREADLRLDQADAAMQDVIVAGAPDDSELISRIFSDDPELLMPPPSSKLALTTEERQTIRNWVQQGANWDRHWAFEPPPAVVAVPEVGHVEWPTNAIDHFVLARLEDNALLPSGRATREALIRRVTFDLTGLPPTLLQIDEFLADSGPNAYERVVDRLLASPEYGERMAVDWLDVARYADTYGYQADRYREMWPWRDWVISAFNDNLAYDRFITWQLAGDLLPDPTRDQILATAFNRNHRQTNEGGSIEEEFRVEYVADRVNTFGAAFLGLTLECCRCHDHKYDPVTQKEYYQFAAFFNSIDESGLYSHFTEAVPTPALLLTTADEQSRLVESRNSVRAAEANVTVVREQREAAFGQWLADDASHQIATDRGLIGYFDFESLDGNKVVNAVDSEKPGSTSDQPQSVPGRIGNGVIMSGDNTISVPAGGDFTRDDPFSISLWINAPERFDRAVVFHRSRAWTDSGSRGYELLIENGRLSAALIHFWPGNAIRIRSNDELQIDEWHQVTMTSDGSSRADGLALFVDGHRIPCTVIRDNLTKHIHGANGTGGGVHQLAIGERFRDVGFKAGLVDELRVYAVQLTDLEVATLYHHDLNSSSSSPLPRFGGEGQGEGALGLTGDRAHRVALFNYYLNAVDKDYAAALQKLHAMRVARSNVIDPVHAIMVMRELPKPRPTFLLTRGAYDAPAEQVFAETPVSLSRLSADQPHNRLGLARWLVDPNHPLTARVTVNRFWQMLFGRGFVSTAEDFGRQGANPSHPKLLDFLSRTFIDSGWDVKALLKQIVMSSTYMQDSDCTLELRQRDPENDLLARGPSQRLSAEMLRDNALAVSELLVRKTGGPSVKPYQPAGLWKEKSGTAYKRDKGEGSHRRSLYTYWKRTSQPPAMMTFDASNREVCVVRRQVTTSPLQVLVLLNDPQFVEAANALAERAITLHPDDNRQQLRFVFRTMTGRLATEQELVVLDDMLQEQLTEFSDGSSDAAKLLATGDHKVDAALEPDHLAALATVAQAMMSYDEVVMKR
jgi:Protein of unknown function (DUF1553)/Protein of unknown function (DUF1549)/Planctomycete cytochrome C/Concanavalin A-like lectin/glucanases superfamily